MAEGTPAPQFGVNLNTREPLIAPDYDLQALLDLSEKVEEYGFDSVWVGDSLFSKPRYEPLALLSAISQRTQRVRLGTACPVTSIRNPLFTAMEWATLDVLSGGRPIFGPRMGTPVEACPRHADRGADGAERLPHRRRGGARAGLVRLHRLLPGDHEHRRLRGGGALGLRRLHLEVLPRAVPGHGPLQLGSRGHAGDDRRVDAGIPPAGRRLLHLPLRRDRPVWSGGALRKGDLAHVRIGKSEVGNRCQTKQASERTPSSWSMSA